MSVLQNSIKICALFINIYLCQHYRDATLRELNILNIINYKTALTKFFYTEKGVISSTCCKMTRALIYELMYELYIS